MKTQLLVHGHALYRVSDQLFDLLCFELIGVPESKRYDTVMKLLETNSDEFEYIDQISIVA